MKLSQAKYFSQLTIFSNNLSDPHVARDEPHMAHKEPRVARSKPCVALCEPRVALCEPCVALCEPHMDHLSSIQGIKEM